MMTAIKKLLNPYGERTELLKDLRRSLSTISQLGVHFVTEAGTFVDFKTFVLPSEFYIPVLDGMLCRVSDTPTDVTIEGEEVFIPHLKEVDYVNGTVILKKAFKGVIFPTHYHLENENLLVVKGSCKVTFWIGARNEVLKETILEPGQSVTIPRQCPHKLEFLEDTIMIANLKPKVPALLKN